MTDNPYQQPAAPLSPSEEKTWAIVQYIGGFIFDVLSPLVAFLLFNRRGPFITSHTKEHLNFSLTVLIAYAVLAITLVGLLFIWVPYVLALIFRILAVVAAAQGNEYRFPLSIRFIK